MRDKRRTYATKGGIYLPLFFQGLHSNSRHHAILAVQNSDKAETDTTKEAIVCDFASHTLLQKCGVINTCIFKCHMLFFNEIENRNKRTDGRVVNIPLKAVGGNVILGYKLLLAEVKAPAHVAAAGDAGSAASDCGQHFISYFNLLF